MSMDYEKAYKDALERAKKIHDSPSASSVRKEWLGSIFPELRESEDERIRKALIQFLTEIKGISECGRTSRAVRREDAEMCNGFLAYLEKQKEQKPADRIEDSLKFEEGFIAGRESGLRDGQKHVLDNFDSYGLCKPAERGDSLAKEMFIKALERAVEQTKKGYELTDCDKHSWWEDFKAYSGIKPAGWSEEDETFVKDAIEAVENYYSKGCGQEELVAWLKSLRPQPQWKPSEEQMDSLDNAYKTLPGTDHDLLLSLYKDLKKLM